jgi:hypothetical protein
LRPERLLRRRQRTAGPIDPLTTSGASAWIAQMLRTIVIFAAIALAIGARFVLG